MSNFFSKMAPREQLILIVMAVLGLIAAVIFFVIKPQLDARAALITKQAEVSKEIDEANKALAQAKALRASAADRRERLARLREAVPEDAQMPALIIDLPQLVDDSGVTLSQFSPAEATQGSGVTTQPVTITVDGDFFDILDFIYRVQNFPRYFKVNKVTITSSTDSGSAEAGGAAALQGTIEAVTFYTAPPPASPSGGTAP